LTVHLRSPDNQRLLREIREILGPTALPEQHSPLAITASVDSLEHAADSQHSLRDAWIAEVFSDDVQLDIVDAPPVHVSLFLHGHLLATQRLDTRVDEITLTIGPDVVRSLLSRLEFKVVDSYADGPIEGVKASLVDAGIPQSEAVSDSEGRA